MTQQFAAEYLASPISPKHLLGTYGTIGLLLIIFAECGLLIGFFLPGDTLLFSAGVLVAINDPSINLPAIGLLAILLPIAAVIGNVTGYYIGWQAGPRVFHRPNSRMFRPEYVTRSSAFFERYGTSTIVVARFVPVVRTVATVMAGVSRMRFAKYLIYSIVGGILWADGVLLLGYWLGHISFVRNTIAPKIDYILLAVVVLSILPTLIHLWRTRKSASDPGDRLPES
jgi:membrane-associated protein